MIERGAKKQDWSKDQKSDVESYFLGTNLILESRILFPLFGYYALVEDNSKPLLLWPLHAFSFHGV